VKFLQNIVIRNCQYWVFPSKQYFSHMLMRWVNSFLDLNRFQHFNWAVPLLHEKLSSGRLKGICGDLLYISVTSEISLNAVDMPVRVVLLSYYVSLQLELNGCYMRCLIMFPGLWDMLAAHALHEPEKWNIRCLLYRWYCDVSSWVQQRQVKGGLLL
jgi:hypothetical protein